MASLSSLARACAFLALTLYTSCSDGDGGPGAVTVYYSMTSYDGCVEAEAFLDLASAHAVLARTDTGAPDCTLEEELANFGCSMILQEVNDGDRLFVTVGGCGIEDVESLFSCTFTTADLTELNDVANTSCGCLAKRDACYSHGICEICASESTNRAGCERCENGVDDDEDGRIDCDDSECELLESCGRGRTTITCIDSTSTTSSTLDFALETAEYEAAPMTQLFGTRD